MSSQKKKMQTEFFKLNVKVLNTISRAQCKYVQSQKKST